MSVAPMSAALVPPTQEPRLRKAVNDLEGVFVNQLFKAMRETVPQDGITSGGSGEEMFTGMFDDHVSRELPGTWQHGVGDALYRQLHGRIPDAR